MFENFYGMFLEHLYCQSELVMSPCKHYKSFLFVMCMVTALLFLLQSKWKDV